MIVSSGRGQLQLNEYTSKTTVKEEHDVSRYQLPGARTANTTAAGPCQLRRKLQGRIEAGGKLDIRRISCNGIVCKGHLEES